MDYVINVQYSAVKPTKLIVFFCWRRLNGATLKEFRMSIEENSTGKRPPGDFGLHRCFWFLVYRVVRLACTATDKPVNLPRALLVWYALCLCADVLSVAESPSFSLPKFTPAQDPVFKWEL